MPRVWIARILSEIIGIVKFVGLFWCECNALSLKNLEGGAAQRSAASDWNRRAPRKLSVPAARSTANRVDRRPATWVILGEMRNHNVTQFWPDQDNARALDVDPFHAVADPTRRAILDRLKSGDAPVTELASGFEISRPAVSRHLRVLRDAKLVRERRGGADGRQRIYSIAPAPLGEIAAWVQGYAQFWPANIESLRRHLEGKRRHPPRLAGEDSAGGGLPTHDPATEGTEP